MSSIHQHVFLSLPSLDVLRSYEGEDIELQLPENMTVYDIDYLGVWCIQFKHNFGHVQIPRPEELWVPPSLGQTRVKVDVHFSCCLISSYFVDFDMRYKEIQIHLNNGSVSDLIQSSNLNILR